MRRLDPRVHGSFKRAFFVAMDCRVKLGNDTEGIHGFPGSQYALSACLEGLSAAPDLARVTASDYKNIT
jgi:hypothetical protein